MDELELLKQDWKKDNPNEFRKYNEDELFSMTKKKSVSVAKWIFIIGLIEILFWIGLSYIIPENDEKSELYPLPLANTILNIFSTISSIIPFAFLGLLIYLNYKIRNTENPKILMKKILMMRNTVKWYIRIFLIQFILGMILVTIFSIASVLIEEKRMSGYDIMAMFTILLILILITFILTLFIRFIYHLIYGNLIYKLEQNYKELDRREEQA